MARQYWLNLFSEKTWKEFQEAGADVTGFREKRWPSLNRVNRGDYFLCYLTGLSRFVGLLEASSEPYFDAHTVIWSEETYPSRVRVRSLAILKPEYGVPIHELLPQLSIYDPQLPNKWSGRVRGSPSLWSTSDGEVVAAAVLAELRSPKLRPIPPDKRRKVDRALNVVESRRLGAVTIPDNPVTDIGVDAVSSPSLTEETAKQTSDHTEIQWRLLKLGNDMGLDVWVARNDRSRAYGEHRFADLPHIRSELPRQFDEATNSTIELIDVLWLKRNAIVAAFEIESTTSIYSGLLRMSDLVAMQPNINIPLYLVAPDERREKVKSEITRPTFSRLSPPLRQICKYIPFSALREGLPPKHLVRYLNPDFVAELSESFDG